MPGPAQIHSREITSRLEDLAFGSGKATFQRWELAHWYGAKRVTKRIWTDIRARYAELTEEAPADTKIRVHESEGQFLLLHPGHLTALDEKINGQDEE